MLAIKDMLKSKRLYFRAVERKQSLPFRLTTL